MNEGKLKSLYSTAEQQLSDPDNSAVSVFTGTCSSSNFGHLPAVRFVAVLPLDQLIYHFIKSSPLFICLYIVCRYTRVCFSIFQ